MIEFIIGLAVGMMISGSDLGEPVPYQTITYSDSGKVVNIYNTSAFKHRYMPNAYAIGWNTNDYRYWDTKDFIKPVYTKSIVINKKPKPRPKPRTENEK
tara:strand:+ start:1116 stop:1412 length:297 start_codon:yes stop_codon:yes gene_type:complete